MSAKGVQKEGFPGQRPKSRAKEGHGRAPSQKQGSLAAMEGTARTRPDILKVVLGPYVQYCPCLASERNWGKNFGLTIFLEA